MRELTMRCSICEAPAAVVDDNVVRTCDHSDAAVIAEMEAVAHAVGSLVELQTE